MTDFKPGDRVRGKSTRNRYTVVFGPYGEPGTYAVIAPNGQGTALAGRFLESDTDPRVDVVAKAMYEEVAQRRYEEIADVSATLYASFARTVLAALDATEPAAPRRYIDSDGDTWEERPGDRLTLVATRGWEVDEAVGHPKYTNQSRESVEDRLGPLTEVK